MSYPADVELQNDLGPEPPQSHSRSFVIRLENSLLALARFAPGAARLKRDRDRNERKLPPAIARTFEAPGRDLVVEELREKLHPEANLSFHALRAGDITGSARAFGSLVTGGLTPQSAAEIVGLDDVQVSE